MFYNKEKSTVKYAKAELFVESIGNFFNATIRRLFETREMFFETMRTSVVTTRIPAAAYLTVPNSVGSTENFSQCMVFK